MIAGKLRYRITVQFLYETKSPSGGVVKEWRDKDSSVWANKLSKSGIEKYVYYETVSETDVVFEIRNQFYVDNLNTKHRVRDNSTGSVYDIKAVLPLNGERKAVLLVCKEKSHDNRTG